MRNEELGVCVIGIMKRLLIILIVSFLAVCSMAQERSAHHDGQVLWVIDRIVMDTNTVAHGKFVTDSIELWIERYFPLIKMDDIKEIQLLRNSDIPIGCGNRDGIIIVITTRKDSGLRALELNGVYTTKRKRIGLAELSCKTGLERVIEKKWRIKSIQSIQIHPEGKTVVDRKGRSHTVFISIETK